MKNVKNSKVNRVLEVVARLGGEATVERIMQRNAKGHYIGSKTVVSITGRPVRDQWSRQYLKNQLKECGELQRMIRNSGVSILEVAA